MITNTNGLIDNIYHYFWLKDDSLLKESFNIKIPDTIIFKNGVASVTPDSTLGLVLHLA